MRYKVQDNGATEVRRKPKQQESETKQDENSRRKMKEQGAAAMKGMKWRKERDGNSEQARHRQTNEREIEKKKADPSTRAVDPKKKGEREAERKEEGEEESQAGGPKRNEAQRSQRIKKKKEGA